MKRGLLLLLSVCVCVGLTAQTLDFRAIANQLLDEERTLTMGSSADEGVWVVAIGCVDNDGLSREDARAKAGLEARKEIAAFLDTKVEASMSQSVTETDDALSTTFSSLTRSDVDKLLKGVTIERTFIRSGQTVAVAVMREKSIDASHKLNAMIDSEQPGVVEAKGIGPTRQAAIDQACSNAVAQVLGSSLVSSDAAADGEFISRTYTDVQGMVSTYRVTSERETAEGFEVAIVAEVKKDELLERYGAQMKSIGDPLFWVECSDETLATEMSDTLIAKGLKAAMQKGTSDYKVLLEPTFVTVTHPSTGKKGTQLQLTAQCFDKAGVLLFSLNNEPRKATVFTGNETTQKQRCGVRAIKQLGRPLHERLQQAIGDMINNGRSVRMVFRNAATRSSAEFIEHLTAEINKLPIATAATYSHNDEHRVSTIRLTLKGNPQDFMNLLRKRVPECPEALSISPNKIIFEF